MNLVPIPGDPHVVAAQADRMKAAAEAMDSAAKRLRNLVNQLEYRSDALDKVQENTDELAIVMTRSAVRYRGTSDALAEYAPALERAQLEANAAIARSGATDVAGARADLARRKAALLDPTLLLDEDRRTQRQIEEAQAESHYHQQQAVRAAAEAQYAQAVADVEVAAMAAAGRIDQADKASKLNDTFADNFNGWKDTYLVPFLDAVSKVLEVVNKIVSVLAVVCAFIPGLQEIAVALKLLNVALSLLSFAVLAIQVLVGEKTFGELLTGALLLAAGILMIKGTDLAKGAAALKPGAAAQAWQTAKSAHPDWAEGGDKATRYVAKELAPVIDDRLGVDAEQFALDPSGYLVDKGAEFVGDAFDAAVPPESLWSPSDATTHDVGTVQADFNGVSADAILQRSFADPVGAPVQCSVGTAGGGGGGGGW